MSHWNTICPQGDLSPNAGICALHQAQQVAIFYCHRRQRLYAVSNFDPVGRANVISRGIMGSQGDQVVVASPLYKQRYDLTTGECLDDAGLRLQTWPVRLHQGQVQLQIDPNL